MPPQTLQYLSVAGEGNKDGSDGNAWDETHLDAALAGLDGNTRLLIAGEDYDRTTKLHANGTSGGYAQKNDVVAVNPTTWLEDGVSAATFNGGGVGDYGLHIAMNYTSFKHLKFANYPIAGLICLSSGFDSSLIDVELSSNAVGAQITGSGRLNMLGCSIKLNASHGFSNCAGVSLSWCDISQNGGAGINAVTTNLVLQYSIIASNGGNGVNAGETQSIIGNIFDDNVNGLNINNDHNKTVMFNKFTNHSGYGITFQFFYSAISKQDHNFFYGNVLGEIDGNGDFDGENNVSMSSGYYEDAENGNYTSVSGDEAIGIPVDVGTSGLNIAYMSGQFPPEYAEALPTITDVSPFSGVEATEITITGAAFGASQGSGDVTVNSVSLDNISWGDTSITGDAPVNADGTYDIIVTNDDSDSVTAPNAFRYGVPPVDREIYIGVSGKITTELERVGKITVEIERKGKITQNITRVGKI